MSGPSGKEAGASAPLRIALILQEAAPFVELTPQGRITYRFIQQLAEQGHELRVFMPRFGVINERKFRLHEVIRLSGVHINVMDEDFPMVIKVAPLPEVKRMQVYFVDHEEFFKRKFIFEDEHKRFFDDNAARSVFYSKGVLAALKILGWTPDIVHIQGWMAAVAPLLMKTFYRGEPFVEESRTVLEVIDGKWVTQPLGDNYIDVFSMDHMPDQYMSQLKNPTVGDLYKVGSQLADLTLWNPHRKRGIKKLRKALEQHANRFKDIQSELDPEHPLATYLPIYSSLLQPQKA